jgi:hypothetical protein
MISVTVKIGKNTNGVLFLLIKLTKSCQGQNRTTRSPITRALLHVTEIMKGEKNGASDFSDSSVK